MTDDEFYKEVAHLLNANHEGSAFPYYRRTRWNNRVAGRGRFEGHGIVRLFGDIVHIALTSIKLNTTVNSREAALQLISERV